MIGGFGDESDEICAFTAEDAPSSPPANISVTATAVDTIFITWGEVPEQERNGIVRGYKVYVKNAEQVVEHESVVNANVTSLEVSNLVHNTYYCVQLLAYTVADGALSSCVNVTTMKDECSNYTVLNGSDRAQRNALRYNGCDSGLVSGWYRFQGAAGNQMPETCVDTYRCGTNAPGWLAIAHPTVAEGVVPRQVCYHWENNCCWWNNNIRVRNCGTHFVYELQKTPICKLRYCGDADAGKLS
ncbi:pancreatic secretory granule membrane major glycoprotein GP2-like [Oculina patagonica]